MSKLFEVCRTSRFKNCGYSKFEHLGYILDGLIFIRWNEIGRIGVYSNFADGTAQKSRTSGVDDIVSTLQAGIYP